MYLAHYNAFYSLVFKCKDLLFKSYNEKDTFTEDNFLILNNSNRFVILNNLNSQTLSASSNQIKANNLLTNTANNQSNHCYSFVELPLSAIIKHLSKDITK